MDELEQDFDPKKKKPAHDDDGEVVAPVPEADAEVALEAGQIAEDDEAEFDEEDVDPFKDRWEE